VRLLKGRIYVDSGAPLDAGRSLRVETEFGSVSHRGTQYQVQAVPGRYLFAAVREGQVEVSAATGVISLARGEGVHVTAANEILRETLPPYSDAWQWVSEYAPEVSIDGRPLSAFIDWYVRETGLTLRFLAPATRADAERTILRGTVSGLSAQDALDAVLATTDLDADLSAPGELRIAERAEADRIGRNGSAAPTHWIHR
jgi:ferric-dicitrate binding protein FerR (iron transport regulator)